MPRPIFVERNHQALDNVNGGMRHHRATGLGAVWRASYHWERIGSLALAIHRVARPLLRTTRKAQKT